MIWDGWTYFGVALAFAGSSPIWLAFGWDAWERLKAAWVPQAEIDRLAQDCIAQFGRDARHHIACDIDRAQRRGETGEYWVLRRIWETIDRMEAPTCRTPH